MQSRHEAGELSARNETLLEEVNSMQQSVLLASNGQASINSDDPLHQSFNPFLTKLKTILAYRPSATKDSLISSRAVKNNDNSPYKDNAS